MLVVTIAILSIAFGWLLMETDLLRLQIPCGKARSKEYIDCLTQMVDNSWIEVEKHLIMKPTIPQLPQFCEQTKLMMQFKDSRYKPEWTNYRRKASVQEMTINRNKIRLNPELLNLYDIISEVNKVQNEKHKPKQVYKAPCNKNITLMNLDSFGEEEKDTEVKNIGLVSIEWFNKHKSDVIPEPTIELIVNEKSFHFNGNYKPGILTEKMGSKIKRQRKLIEV
jgi:hypothetical protein